MCVRASGSRTEQRAAARREGQQRSGSPFGSTASRYMNPRASLKPEAQPERMFRARSVPRGMSPQRSRVADYIKVGSPGVQRHGSTQVQNQATLARLNVNWALACRVECKLQHMTVEDIDHSKVPSVCCQGCAFAARDVNLALLGLYALATDSTGQMASCCAADSRYAQHACNRLSR